MRKSQRGNALVEFAIALPLLMLIAIGLVETGRYAYFSILVGNAAHAGAEYGAQNLTTASDGPAMAAAATADGQSITGLSITQHQATCACWNGTTSTPIASCTTACPLTSRKITYATVTAHGSFTSLFSYPGLASTHIVDRTATIRVRNETQ
jgi:Flp pilus assembly protein TadG